MRQPCAFLEVGLVLCLKHSIQQNQTDTSQVHFMGHVHSAPMFILPRSPLLNHCLFCRRHPRMTVNMRFRLQKKGVRDHLRYKYCAEVPRCLFVVVGFTVMSYQTLLSLALYQIMWKYCRLLDLFLIRMSQLNIGQTVPNRENFHRKVYIIWYVMIFILKYSVQADQ